MFGDTGINRHTSFGEKVDSGLPSSLMGVRIDPTILNFRREIINNRERLKEIEAEIAEKQEEARENMGSFNPSDLRTISNNIRGVNDKNKNLQEVDLSKFKIEVEDADTIILNRKGDDSDPVYIRMAGIDAPEVAGHIDDPLEDVRLWQEQIFGQESTRKLWRLVVQQDNLRLIVDSKNKTYGRNLGVFIGDNNTNLNVEAVRQGYASALPFGSEQKDIVARDFIKRAEEEAVTEEKGLWQYSRYKAAREVASTVGGPVTYNTLTDLIRLSRNLNVGAYGSFLEGFGTQQRELTPGEVATAQRIGRSLRKTHSPNRFKSFKGPTNNNIGFKEAIGSDDHLQVEGLGHQGMAPPIRRELTEFGSGWRGAVQSKVQDATYGEFKNRFLKSGADKNYVGFRRTIGSDDWLQGEGLGHKGIAWQIRQSMTDFGSGSRHVISILKNIPTVTKRITEKQGFLGKIKNIFSRGKSQESFKEAQEYISREFDVVEDYGEYIRKRYTASPLPSMRGLSKEEQDRQVEFLVESEMSSLKESAKKIYGAEDDYKKLLGPRALGGTRTLYGGSKEFYEEQSA